MSSGKNNEIEGLYKTELNRRKTAEKETSSLKAKVDEIERERSEYLQNVAHQLSAPLHAIKGHIENITGWSIGPEKTEEEASDDEIDRNDLYNKLESWVIPKFYNDRDNWIRTMRSCIAINASFFNTNRMVQQYVLNAYFM